MKIKMLTTGFWLSLLLVPMLTFVAQAQWNNSQYPNSGISRFRWEGEVDGSSVIYIKGRNVNVQTRSGLPVQRQRFSFSDPLPRANVDLGLTRIDGRGDIRLVQEPNRNNDYTAIVRIDDRSGGRDFYSFELRWYDRNWQDNGGGWSGNSPRNSDFVIWRGRVDGESLIRFRGGQAWEQTVNGGGVFNQNVRFSSPLPTRSVSLNLTQADGRGEVVLLEQPSRHNDYTATVRIRDRRGGTDVYAFTLAWEKPRYRDVDHGRWFDNDEQRGRGNDEQRRRGVRWSGRVDGRNLLYIRGDQLWLERRDGQPTDNSDFRFYQALPTQPCQVSVRKLNGRGSVRVLEQPSARNNYTAVLLLEDYDGGADQYDLAVEW